MQFYAWRACSVTVPPLATSVLDRCHRRAQVVLLCLASRLDFFPLPVWDVIGDVPAPTSWRSSPWTWGGTSCWWSGSVKFRLEEMGDDYFLVSYPSPEGWRCAVEVHRFLVSEWCRFLSYLSPSGLACLSLRGEGFARGYSIEIGL